MEKPAALLSSSQALRHREQANRILEDSGRTATAWKRPLISSCLHLNRLQPPSYVCINNVVKNSKSHYCQFLPALPRHTWILLSDSASLCPQTHKITSHLRAQGTSVLKHKKLLSKGNRSVISPCTQLWGSQSSWDTLPSTVLMFSEIIMWEAETKKTEAFRKDINYFLSLKV